MNNGGTMSDLENQQPQDMPEDKNIKRRRLLKNTLINAAIVLTVSAVIHGNVLNATSPDKVVKYMENKYHSEFTFIQWYDTSLGTSDRMAIVSPSNELTRKIIVDVYKGEYPWSASTLHDRYYTDATVEYMKKRLPELVSSRYATKIFVSTDSLSYVNPEEMQAIENKYSIEEIKKGPLAAPEAYEGAHNYIAFFGKPVDREAMIREMYEIYKKMSVEMKLEQMRTRMAVVDESVLKDSKSTQFLISNDGTDMCFQLSDYVKNGFGWFFTDNPYGESELDLQKKFLTNYQYFKSYYEESRIY